MSWSSPCPCPSLSLKPTPGLRCGRHRKIRLAAADIHRRCNEEKNVREVQCGVAEGVRLRAMWKAARASPFNGLASPETSPRRKGAPRNFLSQESACHGPPLVRSTRRCAQAVGEVPFLRAPTDCQKATPSSPVQLHVINGNSVPCGVCIASRHTPVCRWKADFIGVSFGGMDLGDQMAKRRSSA